MRFAVLPCLALCGCTAIFDLQAPVRRDAATAGTDDAAPADDADGATPVDAMVDAGPDAAVTCPGTYLAVTASSSRYRYVSQNAQWTVAAATCAADGATTHLLVLSSAAELNGLADVTNGTVWVGLTDRVTEGTYVAVTDEDTQGYPPAMGAPWLSGEPSTDAASDCALLETGGAAGALRAESCTLNREYICECDAHANDPSRY